MEHPVTSNRSKSTAHLSPVDRILSRIEKDEVTGCWNYVGQLDSGGYGTISFRKGKKKQAIKTHRLMWESQNGPIPEGMFVLHQCDNRQCCNPEHLRLGTHQENMHEAKARGRLKVGVDSSKSVMTEDEVYQIRAMYDACVERSAIARNFGVSRSIVYQIGKRQTWKHLPESDERTAYSFRQVLLVGEIVDIGNGVARVTNLQPQQMIVPGASVITTKVGHERPSEVVTALYRFA